MQRRAAPRDDGAGVGISIPAMGLGGAATPTVAAIAAAAAPPTRAALVTAAVNWIPP